MVFKEYKFFLRKVLVLRPCCVRHKSFKVKQKWASTMKKKEPAFLALEHFDFFYKPIFAKRWPSIRLGLLSDQKYCALVNNYSDADKSMQMLERLGTRDVIRNVLDAKAKFEEVAKLKGSQFRNNVGTGIGVQEEIGGSVERNEDQEEVFDTEDWDESDQDEASESRNEEDIELEREMRSEAGLHHFVPAGSRLSDVAKSRVDTDLTELQERDVGRGGDVKIPVLPDEPTYPEHLRVMSFAPGDVSSFPQSTVGANAVLDWYLMDAASIFPVLALGISHGDTVLDLCAAPGGKSLVALQTLLPGCVVCNDAKMGRVSRMRRMLTTYVPENAEIRERIVLKRKDATSPDWDETDKYDKVLVDAPCTTDRHSVQGFDEEDSIFKRSRSAERLMLPNLQTKLLVTGLRAVAPGGTLVYSTCTLSPLQNESVVETALKQMKMSGKYVIKDLSAMEADFSRTRTFKFATDCKYGTLILPFLPANFGPMYVCKIQRAA